MYVYICMHICVYVCIYIYIYVIHYCPFSNSIKTLSDILTVMVHFPSCFLTVQTWLKILPPIVLSIFQLSMHSNFPAEHFPASYSNYGIVSVIKSNENIFSVVTSNEIAMFGQCAAGILMPLIAMNLPMILPTISDHIQLKSP